MKAFALLISVTVGCVYGMSLVGAAAAAEDALEHQEKAASASCIWTIDRGKVNC